MKIIKELFITFLLLILTVTFLNAQSAKYENLDSAVNTLSSYYNAINGKDYTRAFGYWRTPVDSFENFVKGYKKTEKVRLIVEPPTSIEGAAGSLYVQIPTVLITTQKGGDKTTFSGCYILHKSNLRPPEIPKEDVWHIYRADLKAAPVEAEIPELLADACAETEIPQENKAARVLGVISFGTENLDGVIKVPETIEANKDFQITIITTGNGCVSADETGVVLNDMSADVFVYDLTTATHPGIACTMILKQLTHTATLRFTNSGEATIRIWGREQGGNSPFGKPVVVEKRITVK